MHLNLLNIIIAFILQGILVFNGHGFAQEPSEVRVIHEPYLVNYYNNYDMSKKKIKEFISYRNKTDGSTDTFRIERFNKKGEKSQFVSFEGGKRKNVYHYSYYNTSIGQVTQYKHEDLKKQRIVAVSTVQKNKLGQHTVETYSYVNGKDTSSRSYKKFFYDEKDRLTRVEHITSQLNLIHNYLYDGDRLIKLEIHTAANKTYHREIDYIYNDEGLPVEKNTYFVKDTTRQLMSFNKYLYENGKIVEEEYSEVAFPKVTSAKYGYAPDNSISKALIKRDTLYKEIDYTFDKGKITSIKIRTNSIRELNREFPTTAYITHASQLPATYELRFLYDKYGNIITSSTYIDNKLMGSSYNKITYHE